MAVTSIAIAGRTVRVLIVDDHPTVCEGLGHRIAAQADMQVCGEAADVDEALDKIAELNPHVVIVDIGLKHSDGMELLKAMKAQHRHVRAIVHSMYDESVYAARCLHAGAMGYVNKEASPNDVIHAIREVLAGRIYVSADMTNQMLGHMFAGNHTDRDPVDTLTDRQLEVFRLIGGGSTTAQIAERLHISVHTVETHREHIKHKLGVASVPELTRMAVLWGSQKK